MPNWCENQVTITAPTAKLAQKVVKAYNKGALFEGTYPVPKELKENDIHRAHDWRVDNWGTKWDVGYDKDETDTKAEADGSVVMLSFNTAWSPPIGWFHHMVIKGYIIYALYNEGSMGFCGVYEDGEDSLFQYPQNTTCSADMASHLPAAIMDAFNFDWLDEDEDEPIVLHSAVQEE